MPESKKTANAEQKLIELRKLLGKHRHSFLAPANGNLGRLSKDFYLIPVELVEELLG